MKALTFLGSGKLAVIDMPDPKPGPEEVVVRVQTAAVCGTDLHQFRRPEAEQPMLDGRRVVPGHEPAGVLQRSDLG